MGKRHRVVALAPGARYTISLVRFITDDQAIELLKASVGKATAMIPTKISSLEVYGETFGLNGVTTNRYRIGRRSV